MRTIPFAAILTTAALSATLASAQAESTNRVAAFSDWAVYDESQPERTCWGVTAPKETVNTRDGRTVSVRRGDILLFVSNFPAKQSRNEISFTGGYPFAPGSLVELTVGDQTFQLFTDGEIAYAASPEEDARIVTLMKRGTEAVLVGRSARGTQTRDTFSLLGFTAAAEEAERRCAG
jgi:hypothetical protein